MLNEEELAVFLALLTAFVDANRLSAAQTATLFQVSHASMARWLKMARDPAKRTTSIYRHSANPVKQKLEKINRLHQERGMFHAISDLPKQEKVSLLQSALDDKLVW